MTNNDPMSPMTRLLIDSTVGMLMASRTVLGLDAPHEPFVVIAGKCLGAEVAHPRVMLTRGEFVEMFGSGERLQ